MHGGKENMGQELYNCIMGNIIPKLTLKKESVKQKNKTTKKKQLT